MSSSFTLFDNISIEMEPISEKTKFIAYIEVRGDNYSKCSLGFYGPSTTKVVIKQLDSSLYSLEQFLIAASKHAKFQNEGEVAYR